MANERIYLRGKCKWCKVIVPSKFNKWTVELCLDDKSLSTILQLKKEGIKNTLKKDDDGYWITLSRPTQIVFKGQTRPITPPVILDKDGVTLFNGKHIGDYSDLTCKVEVRQYKVPFTGEQGMALRLEAVKVENLVPYVPPEHARTMVAKMSKDMDDAPEADF